MQNIVDTYCWSEQRKILTPLETGIPALRCFGLNTRQQARQPLAPHIHSGCMEIVFLISGFQVYEASDASFNLSGSDIFVAYPDEPHSSNGCLESVNNILWMQLDLTPELPFLGLDMQRAGQLRAALRALPRLFTGDDALRHALTDAFFALSSEDPFDRFSGEQQLVAALIRMIHLAKQPPARKSDRIGDAITYIHDHLAEPIALEDAAAACSLSLSRFKVCFKAETGVTPREYINQVKIRQAQQLLDAGKSVTDAAMAMGFTTPNYFSVLFKKYTGMTPTEYLQQPSSLPRASRGA